jgi:molybdopterin molybdotransferase
MARLGTVVVDEVAMQPGALQGFGTIGPDATPIFTLPADPVAAYISFEVFVRPAIRRMLGTEPIHRPLVRASASAALPGAVGARSYLPVRLDVRDGAYVVSPVGAAGRDHVSALARANALAVIDGESGGVQSGGAVTVMVLERRHG